MRNCKYLGLLLIFLLPFTLYTQEVFELEFTELYVKNKHIRGYFIHSTNGEVIHSKVFTRRELTRGAKTQIDVGTLGDKVITLVFDNANYSYYPLRENMKFAIDDYYPYSINYANGSHSVNFSSIETKKMQLGPWVPSNRKLKYVKDERVSLWYNFLHPMFFPYNYDISTKEYDFFVLESTSHLADRHIILDEQDIYASDKFIEVEFSNGQNSECDILLFTTEHKYPYLLQSELLLGQLSLSVPIPDELLIEKIGIVLKNKNREFYTEIENITYLESHLIEFEEIMSDFKIAQNSLELPGSGIDAFHLFLIYNYGTGDENYVWVLNGVNDNGCQIVLPEMPEAFLFEDELNNALQSPKSGIFYAITLPNSDDIGNPTISEYFDLFWRLENRVLINKFRYDW